MAAVRRQLRAARKTDAPGPMRPTRWHAGLLHDPADRKAVPDYLIVVRGFFAGDDGRAKGERFGCGDHRATIAWNAP